MNSFRKNLKTAWIQSEYALVYKKQKTSRRYRRLEKDYKRLFDQIRGLLGAEHQKLMLELEDLQNALASMEGDWIYKQGLRDCVTLLQTIRLL